MSCWGHSQGVAVQGAALPQCGAEDLLAAGVGDAGGDGFAVGQQCNRHAELRVAAQKVHAAIDRIDHPQQTLAHLCLGAFFPQKPVCWKSCGDAGPKVVFDATVQRAAPVTGRLELDGMLLASGLADHVRGFQRQGLRKISGLCCQRVHVISRMRET